MALGFAARIRSKGHEFIRAVGPHAHRAPGIPIRGILSGPSQRSCIDPRPTANRRRWAASCNRCSASGFISVLASVRIDELDVRSRTRNARAVLAAIPKQALMTATSMSAALCTRRDRTGKFNRAVTDWISRSWSLSVAGTARSCKPVAVLGIQPDKAVLHAHAYTAGDLVFVAQACGPSIAPVIERKAARPAGVFGLRTRLEYPPIPLCHKTATEDRRRRSGQSRSRSY
jgi:hypothetical protein